MRATMLLPNNSTPASTQRRKAATDSLDRTALPMAMPTNATTSAIIAGATMAPLSPLLRPSPSANANVDTKAEMDASERRVGVTLQSNLRRHQNAVKERSHSAVRMLTQERTWGEVIYAFWSEVRCRGHRNGRLHQRVGGRLGRVHPEHPGLSDISLLQGH